MGIEQKVSINENPDKKKWDEFVYNHPSGNIFQTSLMFDVYKATPFYKPGVIALESDISRDIVGIMVYNIIKEPGIKSFFSKRAIIAGGPIIIENNSHYAEIILASYLKRIKKENVIYSEVRNLYDVKPLHAAFEKQRFIYEDHLTIHLDITKPIEELEKGLIKGRVANIKRAIKKNLLIHEIAKEEITAVHELVKRTYDRVNLPSPHIALFQNAFEILGTHVRFAGAYVDNKVVGCRIYLLYKGVLYDWYAATDREYGKFHVGDLLPWSTILWAKQNNFKTYDFAGAGKPNKEYKVRDYKLSFGGIQLNFGRYNYIHKPNLFRLGVLGMKLYKYIK